jgi:hypothetical protein
MPFVFFFSVLSTQSLLFILKARRAAPQIRIYRDAHQSRFIGILQADAVGAAAMLTPET